MTKPTEIARKTTADGKHVCLWSDGVLSWSLGHNASTLQRDRVITWE